MTASNHPTNELPALVGTGSLPTASPEITVRVFSFTTPPLALNVTVNGGSAACVTLIFLTIPPPLTVMVPVLDAVFVLAAAFILNEPLFIPLDGVTDSQSRLLVTLHDLLDVTFINVLFAADVISHEAGSTVSTGGATSCVTLIVLVNPPPVTVIVPVLDDVPVLAVASILIVPLPEPVEGVTVNQLVLLLVALQALVDDTVIVVLFAADARFHVVGDTDNAAAGAAWVTLTVLVNPPPVTVMVPVLDDVPVLAVALILNEPLPVRFAGVMLPIVSQLVLLLTTVHDVLDVMLIKVLSAPDAGFHVVGDTVSVAGGAGWVTVIVLSGTPVTLTVIVPVLEKVVVFACTFILNDPLRVRLIGVIWSMVSQFTLLLGAVHVLVD